MIGEAIRRQPRVGRVDTVPAGGATFLSPNRLRWLSLLPPVLVAVPALVVLALTRFDGLYGQDSFAYFDYATGPLHQALLHLRPPPPFFWPPGYPLLVAAMSIVVGIIPLAGQIVSVTAGAAVPAFTVLLAAEMAKVGRTKATNQHWQVVPLVAGLIVAVTGQLLQSSLVVMTDEPVRRVGSPSPQEPSPGRSSHAGSTASSPFPSPSGRWSFSSAVRAGGHSCTVPAQPRSYPSSWGRC